jgi:hypothetical protein
MSKLLKRIKYHLSKRYKLVAVHAEALFIDKVWDIARLKAINTKIDRWYVMTPANYNYFKGSFNTKYDEYAISQILRWRYRALFDFANLDGRKFGLHVHLSLANNLGYYEQEQLIQRSIKWFNEVFGFYPREIVFGWWLYNKDTIDICKRFNLKIIGPEDYNSVHDYNWQGVIQDDE